MNFFILLIFPPFSFSSHILLSYLLPCFPVLDKTALHVSWIVTSRSRINSLLSRSLTLVDFLPQNCIVFHLLQAKVPHILHITHDLFNADYFVNVDACNS